MRAIAVVALLLAEGPALAQPSLTPPTTGEPQVLALTADDERLLARGEISDDARIGGAITAGLVGYGIGHAIQHRWGETGWVFTVADTLTGGVFMFGIMASTMCQAVGVEPGRRGCSQTPALVGAIAVGVVRAWETIDAVVMPPRINARVRELRARYRPSSVAVDARVVPYLTPIVTDDHRGGVAGIALRF